MVSSWRSGKYSLALTFVCHRAFRQPFSPGRAFPLLLFLLRLHHRKRRFSMLYRAGTDGYTYNRTVLWACSHVKPQPNDLRRLMVVLAVDPRSPRLRDKLLLMKPSRASLSSAFVIWVRCCCSRFWCFSWERKYLALLVNIMVFLNFSASGKCQFLQFVSRSAVPLDGCCHAPSIYHVRSTVIFPDRIDCSLSCAAFASGSQERNHLAAFQTKVPFPVLRALFNATSVVDRVLANGIRAEYCITAIHFSKGYPGKYLLCER